MSRFHQIPTLTLFPNMLDFGISSVREGQTRVLLPEGLHLSVPPPLAAGYPRMICMPYVHTSRMILLCMYDICTYIVQHRGPLVEMSRSY